MEMFLLKPSVVLALSTWLLAFAACDGSKDELAATRTERDQLKTQLATLQGAMDSVKKDFEATKAQAAKCQLAATAAAPTNPAAATPAADASKAAPAAGKPIPAGSAAKKPTAKK